MLEAVRRERKVAWILLTNATVESLTEGVLTVEFAREGDAKGFANSGHDRLLGDVLQQMFGISPQVRATARPPGGGPGGSRGSAGPGAGGPGPGGPGPGGPGGPGGSGSATTGGAGGPAAGGARGAASQSSPNGPNGTAGASEPATSATTATSASPASGNGAPVASSASAAQAARPAPGGPASSWAPDQPPPSWDDPSAAWDDGPEDEDESYSVPGPAVSGDLRPGPAGLAGTRSGPGQDRSPARPSGIDLIARELGGRIVEGLDASGDPLA